MPVKRHIFPEHDLMLHLVWGKHTSKEVIAAIQSMDAACATRWLIYLDRTADMSKIDIAQMPEIRRVKGEKRRELFGDNEKPFAIACGSKESEQYFFKFWKEYSDCNENYFRTLDEAYDWLGLSEAARAAVAQVIDNGRAEPGRGKSEPASLRG